MNIKDAIGPGESEITEFKTTLSEWIDIIETISGSRTGGGESFHRSSR